MISVLMQELPTFLISFRLYLEYFSGQFFDGTVISARFLGNEAKQHRAYVYWVSQIPFCVPTKLYGIMWTYPKTVISFDQHNSYFLRWLGNSLYRILF